MKAEANNRQQWETAVTEAKFLKGATQKINLMELSPS
jgi:hypothetical protein